MIKFDKPLCLFAGIQKCYEEKPVVFNYFKKSQFNLVLFQTPLP